MLMESAAEGCKQARSRSSDSRKEEKRGSVPPMTISAFVMLRSNVQTVAAGSNQHGPSKQIVAGVGKKTSYQPRKDRSITDASLVISRSTCDTFKRNVCKAPVAICGERGWTAIKDVEVEMLDSDDFFSSEQ